MNLLCVICLRGPMKETSAITICSGEAVCRKHLSYVRASDSTLLAIDRAYQESK